MGCVASKLDINDVHPNMFAVNNVDDMGVKLNSGQLEITEVELVLHRRGKQPVKWPLRYLRRYGFEEGLFSFEAGRKNPTGPGIYSFKCRRAENLFNLLQARVRSQVPSAEPVNVVRNQLGTQDVVTSNSSPTGEDPNGQDGFGRLSTTQQQQQSQAPIPAARTSLIENAANEAVEDPAAPISSYINCDLPTLSPPPRVPPLHLPTTEGTNGTPMEVGDEGDTEEPPGHAYENIGPLNSPPPGFTMPPKPRDMLGPKPVFRPKIPSTTSETSDIDIGASPPESPSITETSINYIQLDLDNTAAAPGSKLTSPTYKTDLASPSAIGTKAKGYVTIDFDKTDALIKSANQRFFEDDEPGVRKTRHNSSLSDLGVATKLAHKVD